MAVNPDRSVPCWRDGVTPTDLLYKGQNSQPCLLLHDCSCSAEQHREETGPVGDGKPFLWEKDGTGIFI